MNSRAHPESASATEAANFHTEMEAVNRLVQESLTDLYSPLSNLAAAHIRRARPHVRAAVVLAAGVKENETHLLREQRVLLASALEMLAVALSVHTLLLALDSDDDASLDKSLIGSTILTGDYCFSRAAVLAAQTNSPVVVNIFSQALKTVSEGHLRRIFDPSAALFNERLELMRAGIHAAGHLAGLSPAAMALGLEFATAAATGDTAALGKDLDSPSLAPIQRLRWQTALAWLDVNQSPS